MQSLGQGRSDACRWSWRQRATSAPEICAKFQQVAQSRVIPFSGLQRLFRRPEQSQGTVGMARLPQKYAPFVFGVIQAAITTAVATAIATHQLTGFGLLFLQQWSFRLAGRLAHHAARGDPVRAPPAARRRRAHRFPEQPAPPGGIGATAGPRRQPSRHARSPHTSSRGRPPTSPRWRACRPPGPGAAPACIGVARSAGRTDRHCLGS